MKAEALMEAVGQGYFFTKSTFKKYFQKNESQLPTLF